MVAVVVENVSVVFTIYEGGGRSLRSRIASASTGGRVAADARQRPSVEALADLSLTLSQGDRVALIGHNGAGKTTLLRVLAGIYTPLRGRVRVIGRVAPLFDAGFGMDPEATGYENIRLRALYLGLSRADLEARLDDIASFSELGPFLDMPMRTYSAGMQARLAFAVSTSIDPEILLLDVQIGSGECYFQKKTSWCLVVV